MRSPSPEHGTGPVLACPDNPAPACPPSLTRTRTPCNLTAPCPSTGAIPTLDGAPRQGHLRPVLRPGRPPLRPAHLPLPLGTQGSLYTVRQLRAQGCAPAVRSPAAQILWRRGLRVAYLYRADLALPKTPGHPRPARRPRQGHGRPPYLPHLRHRKALLHTALNRPVQRLHGRRQPMTPARLPRPLHRQEAVDTETALPGRRERRVRRVPPPRHPRLQPPRRRRRHRSHHRHGRLADRPRGGHPPGHHRTPRLRLLLGRHRHAARHHPPGSPATLGRHSRTRHGPSSTRADGGCP